MLIEFERRIVSVLKKNNSTSITLTHSRLPPSTSREILTGAVPKLVTEILNENKFSNKRQNETLVFLFFETWKHSEERQEHFKYYLYTKELIIY